MFRRVQSIGAGSDVVCVCQTIQVRHLCTETQVVAAGKRSRVHRQRKVEASDSAKWSFVAADGIEMPLEEGTSALLP